MVALRLTRMGSKFKPFYRVVAVDSRVKRDGKYIEKVGTYNPMNEELVIDEAIALKWLHNGAQPTRTVKNLLSSQGIIAKYTDAKAAAKKLN